MTCQPTARRLVTRNCPVATRPVNGAMSAGSLTLSSTSSHPSWLASHCSAHSTSASNGNARDRAGCTATASAASAASIAAGLSAAIHHTTP